MSEIKQVQMSMPVLTKTGRKSRKGGKKQLQEQEQSQQEQQEQSQSQQQQKQSQQQGGLTKKQPLVLQQKQSQQQQQKQSAGAVTVINAKPLQPLQPMPIMSTTSVVGGKKKETLSVAKEPQSNTPYDKIKGEAASKAVVPKKIVLAKKAISLKAQPVKTPTIQIQPKTRNNKTLRRNYSAKRITINMENPKNVRKTRDAVRRSVANMPLNDITEKLRQRGLVRAESCPPEHIQRLMLIDIELFPIPV